MKKLFLLYFVVLMSSALPANAQINDDGNRILVAEFVPDKNTSVFSNPENWAEVTIQCKTEYNLTFKLSTSETMLNFSTYEVEDKAIAKLKKKESAVYAKKRNVGDNTEYVFWFRAGKGYERRNLLANYRSGAVERKVMINLQSLSPKSRNLWRIFDPEDANDGSVFQEHNVNAQRYLRDCNYLAARQEFILASYCDASPSDKKSVNEKIAICDSIIDLTTRAEDLISNEKYKEAAELFFKARLLLNNQDKYLSVRYFYCTSKTRNNSAILYQTAEQYFDNKEYATAAELYKKVAEMGTPESEIAKSRAELSANLAVKRKNKQSFLGFELGLGDNLTTFGLTKAALKEKVGGYFTLQFNAEIFEIMRAMYNVENHARLDLSVGCTIPIVKADKVKAGNSIFQGLWINAGIGATGLNIFKPKEDAYEWLEQNKDGFNRATSTVNQEMVEEYKECYLANIADNKVRYSDILKFNFNVAATPEVGLMLKLWQIGVKTSFRYYVMPWAKDANEALGNYQISVGAGFCF